MGRFVRPVFTLILALFTRPVPAPALNPPPSSRAGPNALPAPRPSWYEPSPDDFRPAFARHQAARGHQTWEGYWGWIQTFYEGTRLARGWTDRARSLVAEVRSETERDRLWTRLNQIGRIIAAEWARDYDLRRVSTADLLAWGKMMEKARSRDAGDGAEIHRVLDDITGQIHGKVGAGLAGHDPIPEPQNHPETPR